MKIQNFLKQNWILVLIMIAAVMALLFFVFSFVSNIIYFNDPLHKDQALKAWMTPRYVVMSYDLPPRIVAEVMNLTPRVDKRKRLSQVATDLNITLEELTIRIRVAAEKHRTSINSASEK
ncbi:MAG: hypothetical protein COC17_05680 [Hyphomicrobiales bacterium]|nr:hypothetical protein [Hyphomicrobiales bacterium]PCH50232.1 MAG: hypothetical protein COC17_05680 [Hyphomicrobiales bacterium]